MGREPRGPAVAFLNLKHQADWLEMSIAELLSLPDDIVEACSLIAVQDHRRVQLRHDLETRSGENRDAIRRMVSGG
jgi:hypothetical protein